MRANLLQRAHTEGHPLIDCDTVTFLWESASNLRRWDKKRAIYLYKHHTDEPVLLLVIFEEVDFMRHGKLVNIVENLIAEKRIRPIVLALVKNAGLTNFGGRMELCCVICCDQISISGSIASG